MTEESNAIGFPLKDCGNDKWDGNDKSKRSEENMPTYEYECGKCEHRFEVFQRMTDKPIKKCPKCSSVVKRLMGAGSGIIFKGPGFYANDYKHKKDSAAPKPCQKASKDNPSCTSCGANDGGGR